MNQPTRPAEAGSPIASSSAGATHMTLGEILRQARERQGVTLDQVAQRTKLPKGHLEALEQNSLASLPPGMYQRAEVRAYANAIGLDPHVALAALGRTQAAPPRAAAVRPAAQRARARARRTRRRTRLAGMAVLLLAIPVAVVGYLWRQPQGVTAVPPSSVEVETVPPVAAPDAAADPQPGRAADAPPPQRSAGPAAAAPPIFEYPELRVITDPPGARVTVDGVGWGQSPLTIRALRAGTRLLRVTLDGYATQQRRVVMPDDAPRTTVRITLRPAR